MKEKFIIALSCGVSVLVLAAAVWCIGAATRLTVSLFDSGWYFVHWIVN